MMVSYYTIVLDRLNEKILKLRMDYHRNKSTYMSMIESKLRLKKLDIEDEIEFHQNIFFDNLPSIDSNLYNSPSEEEIFDYISLFKTRCKSSIK